MTDDSQNTEMDTTDRQRSEVQLRFGRTVEIKASVDVSSTGLLAFLGASPVSTGLVLPGEVLTLRFDCDRIGLAFSEAPEQILEEFDAIGQDSLTLERDLDFRCGDSIQFIFLGNGIDFGVLIAVNDRVIG